MSTKKLQVFGLKGEKGTGIKKITQTTVATEDKGKNVVNIALDDGTSYNVEIQNGSKGSIDNIDTTLSVEGVAAESKTTGDKFYELEKRKAPGIARSMSGKSMVAKDSSKNPFTGMKLFGKTTQKSTTGAQLAEFPDDVYTANGVTITIKDGVITCSGTPTVENGIFLTKWGKDIDLNLLTVGETYYAYGFCQLGVYIGEELKYISGSFTYTENVSRIRPYIQLMVETYTNGMILYPRLVAVENANFEPYTGGAPSPSVDYKQELKHLGEWWNLLNLPDVEENTIKGVTWSCKNGVVSIKGTATEDFSTRNNGIFADITGFKGTYRISGGDNQKSVWVMITSADGVTTYKRHESFTLDGSESLVHIYILIISGTTVDEKIYPMLNYGTTALPYRPYSGEKEIRVEVFGGNLFDVRNAKTTIGGVTITGNGNKCVISGTCTTGNWVNVQKQSIPKGTYTISVDIKGNTPEQGWMLQYNTNESNASNVVETNLRFEKAYTFTLEEDGFAQVLLGIQVGEVYNSVEIEIMLNYGDTVLPYEPYNTPQSLITPVSSGLPGIPLGATTPDAIANSPVHMSGVWWDDEEEQYYIGDTKDYESGKYVQRVFEYEFTGMETLGGYSTGENYLPIFYPENKTIQYLNGMSNIMEVVRSFSMIMNNDNTLSCAQGGIVIHLSGIKGVGDNTLYPTTNELLNAAKSRLKELSDAGKPLRILYILATPIETDIPAEEIVAYQKLTTNYPTTTVFNDCDAMIEVGYVADTANYIGHNYVPLSKYTELEERITTLENK